MILLPAIFRDTCLPIGESMKKLMTLGMLAILHAGAAHALPGSQVVSPIELSGKHRLNEPAAAAITSNGVGESVILFVADQGGWEFAEGDLIAQVFDAGGVPSQGNARSILTAAQMGAEVQNLKALLTDDGQLIVAWQTRNTLGDFDIRAAIFDAELTLTRPVFQATDTISGDQALPALALDTLNHPVLGWSHQTASGHRPRARVLQWGPGNSLYAEFELSSVDAVAPVQIHAVRKDCCGGTLLWEHEDAGTGARSLMAASIGFYGASQPVTLLQLGNATLIGAGANADGRIRLIAREGQTLLTATTDLSLTEAASLANVPGATLPGDINSNLFYSVDDSGKSVLGFSRSEPAGYTLSLSHFDADGNPYPGDTVTATPVDSAEATLFGLSMDASGDVAMLWQQFSYASGQMRLATARHQGLHPVPVALTHGADGVHTRHFNVAPSSFAVIDLGLANECTWPAQGGYNLDPDFCTASGVRIHTVNTPQIRFANVSGDANWTCDYASPSTCTRALPLSASVVPSNLNVQFFVDSEVGTFPFTIRAAAIQDESVTGINGVDGILHVGDATPDGLMFPGQTNVTPGATVTSAAVTLSGMEVPGVIATFFNTTVSINGGPFQQEPGLVKTVFNGDVLRVRHTASADFSTQTESGVTIANVPYYFMSTTADIDQSPDSFSLADTTGVARNSVQQATVTVSGINAATPASVTGGELSVNGGPFSAATQAVTNQSVVTVRHTAAAGFAAATHTVLTIGGVSDTFTSVTESVDTTPDAFTLLDQTGLATNVTVTSSPVTVSGINSPSPISVAGGTYSINGGAFTNSPGTVTTGASVAIRVQSASAANSPVNATLTIGGVSDVFTATTGSVDSTPNAFSFTDITGARKGRVITSNSVTVTGINTAVPISVTGGGGVKYSKNQGAFTNVAGTVVAGDQVRLQMTASSSNNTMIDATLVIGGISDVWSVTSGTR